MYSMIASHLTKIWIVLLYAKFRLGNDFLLLFFIEKEYLTEPCCSFIITIQMGYQCTLDFLSDSNRL